MIKEQRDKMQKMLQEVEKEHGLLSYVQNGIHQNAIDEYDKKVINLEPIFKGRNEVVVKELDFDRPINSIDSDLVLELIDEVVVFMDALRIELLELNILEFSQYISVALDNSYSLKNRNDISKYDKDVDFRDFILKVLPFMLVNGIGVPCKVEPYEYNGRTYRFPKGLSYMKTIKKILPLIESKEVLEMLHERLDSINILRSRITQSENARGSLVMSLDPIEFLTASHNQSNWDSCYNFGSDYTNSVWTAIQSISMFPIYIRKPSKMESYGIEHDDKTWRCWGYFYEGQFVLSKGYPFVSEAIEDIIYDFILEELGDDYHLIHTQKTTSYRSVAMFDDFVDGGYEPEKTIIRKDMEEHNFFTVAEVSYCSCCGKKNPDDNDYRALACQKCTNHVVCDWCGNFDHGDTEIGICYECMDDTCECCGEPSDSCSCEEEDFFVLTV